MTDMRRSLLKRAEAIFRLIEEEERPFPKSKLKKIGFNPETAENWLDLIVYIQKQPKIRLIKTGTTVIVEKVKIED